MLGIIDLDLMGEVDVAEEEQLGTARGGGYWCKGMLDMVDKRRKTVNEDAGL
jgi:hypothetical protein